MLRRRHRGLVVALLISAAVHVAMGSVMLWFLVRPPTTRLVLELDLSTLSQEAGGARSAVPGTVRNPAASRHAAAPSREEILSAAARTQSQPEPDPLDAATTNSATAEDTAGYIPAALAARAPRWLDNFISAKDYPLIARQQGKDGRVVLLVRIDAAGCVREVKIISGSYPALNAVALRKVRQAVFSPAYDEHNRPVPCEARIPITFRLR